MAELQQKMLIERVNEGILQVAEAEEAKLDEKLKKLEELGEKSINIFCFEKRVLTYV